MKVSLKWFSLLLIALILIANTSAIETTFRKSGAEIFGYDTNNTFHNQTNIRVITFGDNGSMGQPPLSSSNNASMYYDKNTGRVYISENGGNYNAIVNVSNFNATNLTNPLPAINGSAVYNINASNSTRCVSGITCSYDPNNLSVGLTVTSTSGVSNNTIYDNITLLTNLSVNVSAGAIGRSTFQVNGSVSQSITTVAGNYTAGSGDYTILADATAGNDTITLSPAFGRIYNIKKIDSSTNPVVIISNGNLSFSATDDAPPITGLRTTLASNVFYFPFTPNSSFTANTCGINITTAVGNVRCAVYSSNSSGPASLLSEAPSTASALGKNTIKLNTSINITENTQYYVAVQVSSSILFASENSIGHGYLQSFTYGAFPASASGTNWGESLEMFVNGTYGSIEGQNSSYKLTLPNQAVTMQNNNTGWWVTSTNGHDITSNTTLNRVANTQYQNNNTKPLLIFITANISTTAAGGQANMVCKADSASPPTTVISGNVGINNGLLNEDITEQLACFIPPNSNWIISTTTTNGAVNIADVRETFI